jgi:uncharacterized protein YPO0396
MLSAIKTSLLTDEAVEQFKVKFRRLLQQRPTDPNVRRRKQQEEAIGNVSDAIAKGLYSPTLVKRLQDAEAELAAIPPPSPVVNADDLLKRLPEAVARYKAMAENLGDAPVNTMRARALLKGLIGPILIAPRDGYLVARMGLQFQPLPVCNRGSGGRIPD